MNIIELSAKGPGFFQIIYFKANVGGDTKKILAFQSDTEVSAAGLQKGLDRRQVNTDDLLIF